MNRILVCLISFYLLIGVLIVPLKVHTDYTNNISINSDGSITPSDAPMSTVDNITYILTENMHGRIFIERDNVVLDGSMHMIQPPIVTVYNIEGIVGSGIKNVTIMNCNVSGYNGDHQWGMQFLSCSNMTFKGNNLTDNLSGIFLLFCSNNTITENDFSGNNQGLSLLNATASMITGNKIENNTIGIDFGNSTGSKVYHNNFLNNTQTVTTETPYPNFLDNGVEGNYWSDYNGTDNNQDGIGDTPYLIDANNTDHYPLMGTAQDFIIHLLSPTYSPQSIIVISNSTVTDFADYYAPINNSAQSNQLVQLWLVFSVTGQNGTTGFCRLQIPKTLMNSSLYMIIVDYKQVQVTQLPNSNNGTEYLYFTYSHSTHQVWVFVPEFPSYLILPLFFITALLATILFRKILTRSQHSVHR